MALETVLQGVVEARYPETRRNGADVKSPDIRKFKEAKPICVDEATSIVELT